MKNRFKSGLTAAFLLLCSVFIPAYGTEAASEFVHVPLRRGINFTCLEVEEWKPVDYIIEEKYYIMVKNRGFDHIRLPVNLSLYCDENGIPDDGLLKKIDTAISLAEKNGLYIILDMHGCGNINADPDGEKALLFSLWEILAVRYKDYGDFLLFELLNEPNNQIDTAKLNEIQNELIAVIRGIDRDRVLVSAAANSNTVWSLNGLRLPEDDPNIIVAVHTYDPMSFTHQGAEWGSTRYDKCAWDDSFAEDIENVLDIAASYQNESGRQVWIGEFGTYLSVAGEDDVSRYLSTVTRLCEARGMGWCYWEFWMGFGAYDRNAGVWRDYVIDALIPSDGELLDIAEANPDTLYVRDGEYNAYSVEYSGAEYSGKVSGICSLTLTAEGAENHKTVMAYDTRNEANGWRTWNFNYYPGAVLRLWIKVPRPMTVTVQAQQTDDYKSFTLEFEFDENMSGRFVPLDIPVALFLSEGMSMRHNKLFVNPSELLYGETVVLGNLEYWSAAPEKITRGDANSDGNIDIRDLVAVKKYASRLIDKVFPGADSNSDGKIDSFDIVLIRKEILCK